MFQSYNSFKLLLRKDKKNVCRNAKTNLIWLNPIMKAMGNTVVAISTNAKKREAVMEMGADEFVNSKDPESMAAVAGTLNLIVNTASAKHDLNAYPPLLARNSSSGGHTQPHSQHCLCQA